VTSGATPPIVIRPLDRTNEREVNLVRSSWYQSQREWRQHGEGQEPLSFADELRAEVDALLATSTVLVATEPRDLAAPDTGEDLSEALVFGWIASAPPGLARMTYVKRAFRGFGIARALWRAAGEPRRVSARGFASEALEPRYNLHFEREPTQ
jgi:GNAT superfamily N-acetyltransferase